MTQARLIRTACQVLNCSYGELKSYGTPVMQHVMVLLEAGDISL